MISRGEPAAASWSGSASPLAGGPASTTEIGRSLEGSMLGPYRLDRFIGGGGMGAVFQALDTTLDRIVAVKVLAGRQGDDEEMLKRFRNEAQSAARLDHENIGRVHAVGSTGGWHYIVFEFIEGTNLRDLVREEGPFDLARAVDVAIQVADALEHASERDVVHRDIKPSNIVITPTGRARIVDMGLARLHHVADDRDLTVSGMTLGTFDYISPEQARDPRAADVRSDLYSLGCTIFYMLVGRPPFAEGTMVQKLLQHQQAAPPPLREIRPDVPQQFADIVSRLMEKDPLDRYQRPAVLVADLVAFADDHRLALAQPRPAQAVALPASRPLDARLNSVAWLLPLAGLAAVVGLMWMRASADRYRAAQGDAPERQTADAPAAADIVRVVAVPSSPNDVATLGEAIRLVADGGLIELADDGERREPPVSLQRKRLTIRAAAGVRPIVTFTGVQPADGGWLAACTVGDGELTVSGVSLRLVGEPADGMPSALFAVGSGRLVCDDVVLRMPGSAEAGGTMVRRGRNAFVAVSLAGGPPGAACAVVLGSCRAAGDAVLLDAAAEEAGRIVLRWSGGALVTPRRLLVAEGARSGAGLDIACDLADVAVACGEGVVALRDSPTRPVAPRLEFRASDCRFVVGDTQPFIEQMGGGDADGYRAACVWLDEQGRYEGAGVFQRIDAADGRVDIDFPAVEPTLVHEPRAGRPPDPAAWNGWGS
ncbi:MAG: serine/threonine protein kinase [Planctomycetia bacterium]|nr:serine/threonine protein kinase [Planctomycetia bacterium]